MDIFKQKNVVSYLATVVFITMSYSLPHAVLTVLLLSKGISVPQIMLIQACYSFAIILSEFPSGVIADLWSRKMIFIISKLLLILMFLIILFSNSFFMMCLAWLVYGMASALDSGTIDSQIIMEMKESGKEQIDKFISIDNNFTTAAMIIGSIIGGVLYHIIGVKIYFIGIIFAIIGIIICWKLYRINDDNRKKNITNKFSNQLSNIKKEIKENKYLRNVLFLGLFSQIFFQTHYQLWQAFLIYKHVDSRLFLVYYLVFQLITMVSYSIPVAKLDGAFSHIKARFLILLVTLIPILLLSDISLIYNITYIIYIFIFYIFEYLVEYLFNKEVSSDNISSLISLKSTINRVSSVFVLLAISLGLHFFNVEEIVVFNFVLSFLSVAYMIIISRHYKFQEC